MTDTEKRLNFGINETIDKLMNGHIHPITARREIIDLITELKILNIPAVSESVCDCPDYTPPILVHDKFNCSKCNGMRYY